MVKEHNTKPTDSKGVCPADKKKKLGNNQDEWKAVQYKKERSPKSKTAINMEKSQMPNKAWLEAVVIKTADGKT